MKRLAGMMVLLMAWSVAAGAADQTTVLRRGYVDDRYGQLHYVMASPAGGGDRQRPVLVLFHQSPRSSVEYLALVKELGKDRVVMALDTPGHGSSDGPAMVPRIEELAAAMHEALVNLGFGPSRPIDVFGNHTGSRIVAEIAATDPRMIRRVMMGLSGVSVVPAEEMAALARSVYHPVSAADAFTRFCARLPRQIESNEASGVPDLTWGAIAVEQLRGLTRYEYGHAAAFEYGTRFDARLAQLTQPVSFLVIEDGMKAMGLAKYSSREMSDRVVGMLKASKRARVLPGEFRYADLHTNAKAIADVMRRFQDEPD